MLTMRVLRYRPMQFRPRIVTSLRPHGKWGDLLVCLIPIFWCFNILVNSSFYMKVAEWQNDATVFTLRVRGRQWYWVYKFDIKSISDIFTAPKGVGRSR